MPKPKKSKDPQPRIIPVTLNFDASISPISAGLRIGWLSGEDKKHEVDLACGAGVGSPFLTFTLTDKGTKKNRYAVADIRPIIAILAKALAELP